MPTYQYACTECGEQLEVVQKFSDDPLTVHDACGGRLRKVFSPVGIVFKGSGFYRTDSRNGSANGSKKAAETSPAKSESSSESTSPATKSEKSEKPQAKPAEKAAASSGSSSSSGEKAA